MIDTAHSVTQLNHYMKLKADFGSDLACTVGLLAEWAKDDRSAQSLGYHLSGVAYRHLRIVGLWSLLDENRTVDPMSMDNKEYNCKRNAPHSLGNGNVGRAL